MADRRACRRLIRTGSRSFFAASLLLPRGLRDDAYALYAFCRVSDDLVDVEGGSQRAIARLRERLDLAYAGRPADHAVDRAFADVVVRAALPRELPEALIDGLEWDVAGVACDDLDDLCAYAIRVAGSVGAMMTVMMGVRDPETLARACDLGVAMQLTNVARDVGEDARAGRLYLPRAWLRDEGIDPDLWLARPVFTPEIRRIIDRLLRAAEALYRRADAGIGDLPRRCRPGIFAARHLYREIGEEIGRNGFDSVSVRARVSGKRKLRLLARSVAAAALVRPAPDVTPPLAQATGLIRAVADSPSPVQADRALGAVSGRVVWVAELFAALDHRERGGRAVPENAFT